jgi:hypothetical protein
MVLHGYKRPGHGYVVGDCPGVDHVPYEVSCNLVSEHIVNLRSYVVTREKRLAELKAGTVTELLVEVSEGRGWDRTKKLVTLVAGSPEAREREPYRPSASRWQAALEYHIYEAERDIRHAKHDIERCTRRVEAWVAKPVRTVEEELKKDEDAKAARKAEREAARKAKADKKAALEAKRNALEASRTAIRKDFEAKFTALAAEPGEPEKLAARGLLRELEKKKYSTWLWKGDLDCTDAIVKLGLAKVDGTRVDGRPWLKWF